LGVIFQVASSSAAEHSHWAQQTVAFCAKGMEKGSAALLETAPRGYVMGGCAMTQCSAPTGTTFPVPSEALAQTELLSGLCRSGAAVMPREAGDGLTCRRCVLCRICAMKSES